jgi:prepilin-type N-terminal cleavage/methylation domain-containing protein
MRRRSAQRRPRLQGFSLVELLVAMSLLALLMLSVSSLLLKGTASSSSINMRFVGATEIQMLITDIQQDFRQGVSISDNSYDKRLEYTTYDASGVATKKIYQIITSGGLQYLQLSTDGGTTWGSPYRVSTYDDYILKNTPRFLYAWSINNCTDFVDSSGNGVWSASNDTAGAYLACTDGTSSPPLSAPSQANKIDLQGFLFSTNRGTPEATRSLPTDLFIGATTPLVRTTGSVASPATQDSALLHSFVTNTSASLFGTTFDLRSVAWDPSHEQLFVVGRNSASKNIFIADRRGVLMKQGSSNSGTNNLDSVAVVTGGTNILALDASGKMLYSFNTSGSSPLGISSSLNLASPTNLINSPTGIAYDDSTPDDFYIVGTDPSSSAMKIYERNISSGALVGSAWSLPSAFDSTHPPSGLAIEPVTGDFLVVRNYINGSSPNKTIDIYVISRAAGTSSSFSVNIDDLGSSSTTGITGYWGIGYDAINNRLFLSDSAADKVYEIIPSQLISPRS